MDKGERLIIMGDWNSEFLELKTWMKTKGLTNTICDLHGYSDVPITYKKSKEYPINGIYCTYPLTGNQGGFLYFGRLVGDHQALWIELHEIMLLGFWQYDIIPPMAWKLRLKYPRMINKFNDTLHTSFVKYDIYQKVHYLNSQGMYTLPAHIIRSFERLDELIN